MIQTQKEFIADLEKVFAEKYGSDEEKDRRIRLFQGTLRINYEEGSMMDTVGMELLYTDFLGTMTDDELYRINYGESGN